MSDFEDRLAAALADGAEGAPAATGLAAGSRRRSRARRHRLVAVAAIAAVVIVAVPTAVVSHQVSGARDPRPAGDVRPTTAAPADDGWTSATALGVSFDLPPGWTPLGCIEDSGSAQYFGPDAYDGCRAPVFAAVVSHPVDFDEAPGVQAGYVRAADSVVQVQGVDVPLARRLLASARAATDDTVDVSSWSAVSDLPSGWRGDVPDGASVDIETSENYTGLCKESRRAAEREGDDWRASVCDGSLVTVTAPTRALADVVASGLTVSDDAPEGGDAGWQTVTHNGVDVDVPAEWAELGTAECDVSTAGAADFEVGLRRPPTSGVHPCDATTSVRISHESRFRYVVGLLDGSGNVLVGDQLVQVSAGDHETARRILASARPAGSEPLDLARWTVRDLGGATIEVPDDAGVEVVAEEGATGCAPPGGPTSAVPTDDGRWQADFCRDVAVRVIAPTQALTSIVVATVIADPYYAWQSVTLGDATVDVPAGWTSPPGCGGPGPAPVYGPPGAGADVACREVAGVFLYSTPTFDPAVGEGVQACEGARHCGYRVLGDDVIFFRGVQREVADRIYDSVR